MTKNGSARVSPLLPLLFGWTSLSPAAHASTAPEVFGPGTISGSAHEAAPAFTPDGNTLYFQRSTAAASVILVTHRRGNGHWSPPQIAPFSGAWSDLEPAMAPDGSFLIFISDRPIAAGGKTIEGFYNGKKQNGGNLWRVDRRGNGWNEAVRLPDTVNRSTTLFAPNVVKDGSVYFMEPYGEKHRFRLYRSQYREGMYQPAEPLAFSDGTYSDVDPAVAPDESFMIFGSGRPPATSMDLFITRREGTQWSTPQHLSELSSEGSDAEPRLSPDLKTLYFSSERVTPITFPRSRADALKDLERIQAWDDGQYNIWSVSLSELLQKYPPARE
jgi:Tol biopolymer transport system component